MYSSKERIEFIKSREHIKAADLMRKTGVGSATWTLIKQEKNFISPEIARRLKEAFPQYSFAWLSTGEGDPFASDDVNPLIENLERILKEKQDQIAVLEELIRKKQSQS